MRKAIQIAEVDHALHALCDDGTMWCHGGGAGWQSIEAIPQPADEPEFQEVVRETVLPDWKPWNYSAETMWTVEPGTLLVDQIMSEMSFVQIARAIGRHDSNAIMVRAKDAAEALAIYERRDTEDTVTRNLTIDGASYLYLEDDTVPF